MPVEPPAPAPVAQTTAPATNPPAFFVQDFPRVNLDWDNQVFQITRRDADPISVTTEEMINCILASMAMSCRWKMEAGAPPRYDEIILALMACIPSTSPANFSIIINGELEKPEKQVTYDCVFSADQLKSFVDAGAITGNIYVDVKNAYPKPSRPSNGSSKNNSFWNLIDIYNFNQDVIIASMHDSLLRQHKQKVWHSQKAKQPKSLRGAERYAASEAGGSTVSLTEKMNMWRLNRADDSMMDSVSEAGGPSGA
ncbi:hypothetical protein C8R42DRAFT_638729 [Lentinula raphanica]|nr:hypothetical protein C8R42DRAFT_638729 [Lentinula raphanica]